MRLDFILQRNNARPHIARAVRDFLDEHSIEVMKWPTNSSDMNPTEHLLDTLERAIR
ncbi:DDE 3 domain containing protein, partial [Asbolus verrucosus]